MGLSWCGLDLRVCGPNEDVWLHLSCVSAEDREIPIDLKFGFQEHGSPLKDYFPRSLCFLCFHFPQLTDCIYPFMDKKPTEVLPRGRS